MTLMNNRLFVFMLAAVLFFVAGLVSLFASGTSSPHWPAAIIFFGAGLVFLALAIREIGGKNRS